MRRYYFDLHNGFGLTSDDEGQEAADDAAARALAVDSIRSVLSSEVRGGVLDLGGRIEIRDDNGGAIMQVRFDEAVEVLVAGTERR